MTNRIRVAVIGLVFVVLVTLSVGAGTTADEPDPEQLLDKAVDSLENEPVEAVHIQKITRPDGTVTQTVAFHKRSSQYGYLEIIEDTGDRAGQQILYNESTVWRQTDHTAIRYEGENNFWFDEFQTAGAEPGVVTALYEEEYKGTSVVNGHETYVVELEPPEETTADLSLDIDAGSIDYEIPIHEVSEEEWYLSSETWWIDSETYYPIKQTVEWTDSNGNVIATATREYEELRVGPAVRVTPGLNDSLTDGLSERPRINESDMIQVLADERSANGTESSTSTGTDTEREATTDVIKPDVFETRAGVDAFVPYELPAIDVPAGYDFDSGIVQSYNGTHTAMLLYAENGTDATLSIRISDGPSSLFQGSEQPIYEEPIDDIEGKLRVTDSGTEVVRQCETLTYRIRGPPAADELVQVTKSIECK